MILDKNKNKSCQNEPKLSAKIYIYWKFQLSLTWGTQKTARIPKKVILSSVKQKLFQNPAVLIMNGLYNTFFERIQEHNWFLFFDFFRTIQDPASQRLTWYKPPLTVLIIKKIHDAAVISPFIQLVSWFTELKRYSEIISLFICNIFLTVKNRPKFTNLPNSAVSTSPEYVERNFFF